MFNELHVPSLRQSIRKQVYEILEKLLNQYPENMQVIGRDFVVGVIQAVDMEKDPRNLMISFNLVKSTVTYIPVFIEFAEELFEVVSCYFPISIRSDSTDPDAVRKEDLQESLLDVISCTSGFAKFSIPFFLDKINEVAPPEKLEAFHALAFSIERYHKESKYNIHSHPLQHEFGAIWSIYRSELTSPADSEYHQECLGTLAMIVKALSFDLVHTSDDETANKSVLDHFLTPIIRDCVHQMTAPDMNLASRSALILASCARQSLHACRRVIGASSPIAVQAFLASDDSTSLQANRMVNWFTKAAVAVFEAGSSNKVDKVLLQKLQPIKNKLLPEFKSIMNNSSHSSLRRASAIDGIQAFAGLPGLLESTEETELISLLTEVLLQQPPPGVDRSAQRQSLDALVVLQKQQAEIIENETIPLLFNQLNVPKDQANEEDWSDEEDEPEIPSYALQALLVLSKPQTVYIQLVTKLLDHIASPEGQIDLSKEYVLKKLGKLQEETETEVAEWNQKNLLPRCISIAVEQDDATISSLIATMLRGIVKRSDEEHQRLIIGDYLKLFYTSGSQELIDACHVSEILPFTGEWTTQHVKLLPVVAALIIPCKAKILQESMEENDQSLLLPFTNISLSIYKQNVCSTTQDELLGAVINKCGQNKTLLDVVQKQIVSKLEGVSGEESEQSLRDMKLVLSVTKALCLRSHPLGWDCVRKLCLLVNQSHVLSPHIINGFKQILNPSEAKENNFVVRVSSFV